MKGGFSMNRIDELWTEIEEKEIVEIKSTINQEKQKRVEAMILSAIQGKNTEIRNVRSKLLNRNQSKISKKKLAALLFVAVFLLGMTVYAAEKKEWDIAIVNYMGISNADTVQLEDGVVEIGDTSESNGITMKAVTSVGDKNSAYIRIDTDYKLPEDFEEKTDYILPYGWDIAITNKTNRNTNHGATINYFNHDGYLSFMMYLSNCDDINKKYIKIGLSDLYIYRDLHASEDSEIDHGTLLLKGTWELSWKYNYRSNLKTWYPLKKVVSNHDNCLVTKIEISPISIRAEAIKNPRTGKTETSELLIRKVTMKDGNTIKFDSNSSGGCKNNFFLNGYRDIIEMKKTIDPSQVYSVTIGNTEIVLS